MCYEFQGLIHFLWVLQNFPSLPKNMIETVSLVQDGHFGLKIECLLFRILEKCLLRTFSTLDLVSNGTKFSNFRPMKCKIRFSKNCRKKLKFLDFVWNEFLRTHYSFSILIDHFQLDFMEEISFSCIIKPSLLNLDFWDIEAFRNIVLVWKWTYILPCLAGSLWVFMSDC